MTAHLRARVLTPAREGALMYPCVCAVWEVGRHDAGIRAMKKALLFRVVVLLVALAAAEGIVRLGVKWIPEPEGSLTEPAYSATLTPAQREIIQTRILADKTEYIDFSAELGGRSSRTASPRSTTPTRTVSGGIATMRSSLTRLFCASPHSAIPTRMAMMCRTRTRGNPNSNA